MRFKSWQPYFDDDDDGEVHLKHVVRVVPIRATILLYSFWPFGKALLIWATVREGEIAHRHHQKTFLKPQTPSRSASFFC